jgi:hypothetical protein
VINLFKNTGGFRKMMQLNSKEIQSHRGFMKRTVLSEKTPGDLKKGDLSSRKKILGDSGK